jgi:multidrug efflux pump
VFATVLSLLVMLVGVVSFSRLTVREYPRIEEPVVTVETRYAGASAEIIESQVAKPLEDSIAGIEGVDVLTSFSRAESSSITVRFKLERDVDDATSDVRDRVARVRRILPQNVDEPVVAKVESDAFPVIWLALTSDTLSPLEVSDIGNRIVKPRLQTLPGAANVWMPGERKFAMRIWLNADQLAAYRLTPQDVEDALRRQNVELPAGRIESQQREFSVVAATDLQRVNEFRNIVVRTVNGYNVRLSDVARVEQSAASERSMVRFNGQNAVGMGVIKQATANPLELSKAVMTELPRIEADLPAGVKVTVSYDSSVFIDRSIKSVYTTMAEAVVLVALVVFVFLRSLRASIIPLVTIPVSLIGAFALMLVMGFSLNTLTLLALVLAIGLVVDDSIVVLENITRHIEAGMKPFEAAIKGSREIGFAVIAMTLTLAAVYAPMAFTTGRTGKLFIEFALTLAGAVLVSGFVALTLSPMMCSKLLKRHVASNPVDRAIEGFLARMTAVYGRALSWSLAHRWVVLLVWALFVGACVWFYMNMKRELAPMEDRGVIVAVYNAPEGASLQYTDRYARAIESIAMNTKDIERTFIIVGSNNVNSGISFIRATDWDERERKTFDIAREMTPKFMGLPGVMAFPVTPPSLGQGPRAQPVNFVVLGTGSYAELQQVVQGIIAEAQKNPGLQSVDSDLRLNKPELRIDVDRERTQDAGAAVETVGRTIETMLSGRTVTRYKKDGEQYDVIVQLEPRGRDTPDDISRIYVRGKNETMVPLASVLNVRETLAPRELNHFSQRRAVTITANLAPGYSLGQALDFMESTARQQMKPGYAFDYTGLSREFKLSSNTLAITFVLAILFIYLVLAAQFESFIDPFVIMLTVPLSIAGALAALMLTGGSINVYSQIGLITLVGLITKNGILIVEFANHMREEGKALMEAVRDASVMRLRPILMTTLATVFGAVPLAIATGAGAESRVQIGWVIVGGLTLGTLLTLFVVPAVYSLLSRRSHISHTAKPPVAATPTQEGA